MEKLRILSIAQGLERFAVYAKNTENNEYICFTMKIA
jgi:hypothetical protein